jgi:hypothetical protein
MATATIYQLQPAEPVPEVTLQQAASQWAGREVLPAEVAGEVDSNRFDALQNFTVKLYDGRQELHISITAHCWYEAWQAAVNKYGMRTVATVSPHTIGGKA